MGRQGAAALKFSSESFQRPRTGRQGAAAKESIASRREQRQARSLKEKMRPSLSHPCQKLSRMRLRQQRQTAPARQPLSRKVKRKTLHLRSGAKYAKTAPYLKKKPLSGNRATHPTPHQKRKRGTGQRTFLSDHCAQCVCVKAKGKEDPHLSGKKKNEGEDMDMVAIDYASIGEGEDSHARKLLIGRDRRTKYIFCHLVKRKGMEDERIVGKLLRSITEIGNTKMILKTDGEPALVQVQEEIINRRPQRTIPENPPAYDPQSNGAAERAVQEIKAQLRAIKLGLEARLQKELEATLPILEWMIPHAANTINRFLFYFAF